MNVTNEADIKRNTLALIAFTPLSMYSETFHSAHHWNCFQDVSMHLRSTACSLQDSLPAAFTIRVKGWSNKPSDKFISSDIRQRNEAIELLNPKSQDCTMFTRGDPIRNLRNGLKSIFIPDHCRNRLQNIGGRAWKLATRNGDGS